MQSNNIWDYVGQGLSNFAKNLTEGQQTAQKYALEQRQIDALNAYRQSQMQQMLFEQGRQQKTDWQNDYDRGMKQVANNYLAGLLTGQSPQLPDASVLGYMDPSTLATIQQKDQDRATTSALMKAIGGNVSPSTSNTSYASPSDPLASKKNNNLPGNLDFAGAAAGVGAPELASFLPAVVKAESGGNPNAQAGTSSAYGLGQFTKGTRQAILDKYGVDAWSKDPNEQLKALAYLAKDNRDGLASSMGTSPDQVTPQQIYMANFLGHGGANTFLKGLQSNPDTPAVALVSPDAARANAGIFFKSDKTPRTAQEVFDLMGSKVAPVQLAQAGPQTLTDASGAPAGQTPPTQQPQGAQGSNKWVDLATRVAPFVAAPGKAGDAAKNIIGVAKTMTDLTNPQNDIVERDDGTYMVNKRDGTFQKISGLPGKGNGAAFGGQGMDQQSWSVVNDIAPKIQTGNATADERRKYMIAEAHLTTPKVTIDPTTGAQAVMQLDLGQFGFPSLKSQGQPQITPSTQVQQPDAQAPAGQTSPGGSGPFPQTSSQGQPSQQPQAPQQGPGSQTSTGNGYTITQTSGPKALTANDAGKIQGATLSLAYLDDAEKRLFPGGEYDRTAMLKSYIPGTDETDVRNKIREAIGYALYLKTGAAATPKEIAEQETLYTPGLTDSASTAKSKLDRLRSFLGSVVQGTGRSQQNGVVSPSDGQQQQTQPDLKAKYGLE